MTINAAHGSCVRRGAVVFDDQSAGKHSLWHVSQRKADIGKSGADSCELGTRVILERGQAAGEALWG